MEPQSERKSSNPQAPTQEGEKRGSKPDALESQAKKNSLPKNEEQKNVTDNPEAQKEQRKSLTEGNDPGKEQRKSLTESPQAGNEQRKSIPGTEGQKEEGKTLATQDAKKEVPKVTMPQAQRTSIDTSDSPKERQGSITEDSKFQGPVITMERKEILMPNYALAKFVDLEDEYVTQDVLDMVSDLAELNDSETAAKMIKEKMDKSYSPCWHVAVGESFAFDVTYEPKCLAFVYTGTKAVVTWKCD